MQEAVNLVAVKLKLRREIPALEGKVVLCSKYQRVDKDKAVQLAEVHRRYNNKEWTWGHI